MLHLHEGYNQLANQWADDHEFQRTVVLLFISLLVCIEQ